jgi:hypothetical protein
MVAPLIGSAARMVGKKLAKKIAENPQKSLLGGTGATLGTGTYLLDATADKSYEGPTVRDQIKDFVKDKPGKDKESEKKKDSENVEKKAKGNSGGADSDGMKKGGSVSSASKRADGCAMRGKTKGRMV